MSHPTLPVVWRFRTDPADEGVKAGWNAEPDAQSDAWRDIRMDAFWTDQGITHYGAAWEDDK